MSCKDSKQSYEDSKQPVVTQIKPVGIKIYLKELKQTSGDPNLKPLSYLDLKDPNQTSITLQIDLTMGKH